MFRKFSKEQLKRAQKLVSSAHAYAITSFRPMLDKFPGMKSIANSGLIEFWDYLITISAVGTAFTAIVDTLPPKDHAGMPYAVKETLNHWKANSYDEMIDFLNYYDKLIDLDKEIPDAIGRWIWSKLEKNSKANNELKALAASWELVHAMGLSILTTFFYWWAQTSLSLCQN